MNAWSTINLTSGFAPVSIAYGAGLFVALGGGNGSPATIQTSPDGVTWTARTTPGTVNFATRIVYGNGIFVTDNNDGSHNDYLTSPDGINWTTRNVGSFVVLSIQFAGSYFWGGSSLQGTIFHRSSDGINWITVNHPNDGGGGHFGAIAYGAGMYLMSLETFFNPDDAYYSLDGTTWDYWLTPPPILLGEMIFANGVFAGIVDSTSVTSPDGVTWSTGTISGTPALSNIAWDTNLGLFAAVGFPGGSPTVVTSLDGLTWTTITAWTFSNTSGPLVFPTVAWGDIASNDTGRFVAVNGISSGSANQILRNIAPPSPVANFSALPVIETAPATINFTDTSQNHPTSWLWDFGDGHTSTSQNPTHIYTVHGTYTVSLTATNVSGPDSDTKISYIIVSNNNLYLQTIFMVGADTDGDVQTINAGKSDDGDPIYYELETQELEFGNRMHLKKVANNIAVFTNFGSSSSLLVSSDNQDYQPVNVPLSNRVNIGQDIDIEGHFITFKWLGSATQESPIFEGLWLENISDLGMTYG